MEEVDKYINSAALKRSQANIIITECRHEVLKIAGLRQLNPNDYEHYGPRIPNRQVACFSVNSLSPITLNAFNYSERLRRLAKYVYSHGALPLGDILQPDGLKHTSSFPRIEINSPRSIRLLGQKELFTLNKKGKQIARIFVPQIERASYGEVIIAGVGTMGETELFGRAEFVGGELEGELLAGEFIRMNTIDEWHPGYLYAWLSSQYGFRMIRGTEAGTKLCRPIKALLKKIPVPDIPKKNRDSIGVKIERAYQLKHQAREEENIGIKKVDEWLEELMN
jgi:type I restriction enzyme S subunit